MDSNYDHKSIEEKCENMWSKFKEEYSESKKTFSIVLAPPNANNILHLGHALNSTINDVLCRYHKLLDYNISFIAGTDHAGLSTELAVSKKLLKEGKNKNKMTKEEFLIEADNWVETHGKTILSQIKKLGCMCNWSNIKFTKSPEFSKLVNDTFVSLYNDGYLYRGSNYLCNWCYKCQTVLCDDEVNNENEEGKLYYIKYIIENSDDYLIIATTRPETIFGDTAIAINPKHELYSKYIGLKCHIPLSNKLIPIIQDESIDLIYGSGAMKVTPAHNKIDNELGKKHSLESVTIIDKVNKLTNTLPEFNGLKLDVAKQQIIKTLEDKKHILKIEKIETVSKKCYRCNTDIENILSDQWFVKMNEFAKSAIENVDKIDIVPKHHKAIYLEWLTNIRDWSISRQIHYGHQIPAWYCLDCDQINVSSIEIFKCTKCMSSNIKKDNDTLDTWFSSWLYSFGVFNEEEEKRYFPLSTVVTGSDILFFWITRMIMASLKFKNKMPFERVYLHGIIRDEKGLKMSKTLGNGIDPLIIIDKIGADALRFGLMYNLLDGKDMKLGLKSFDSSRKFCTKFWNVSRYLLLNRKLMIQYESPKIDYLINENNKNIINKLKDIELEIHISIKEYKFCDYAKSIYAFVWNDFCNGYIEDMKSDASIETILVHYYVLHKCLLLLHPIIPFITEEIYQIFKLENPDCELFKKGSIILEKLI